MDLKIIVTYDVEVDDDLDLENLAAEIYDDNYLEARSIDGIGSIDSVHIATTTYTVKADDEVKIGKVK